MDSVYLVLIETSGNQSYIFATNRLQENIGASELTYQATTYWVGDAVDYQNKQEQFKNCHTPATFRTALNNQRPLEEIAPKAEIIVAASGKALILTKDEDTAKAIISEVTRRALIEAPGLDIAGVYETISVTQKFANEKTLGEAIKKVHKTFEKLRSRRPSPENRFLRLPIVASCAVSGLPASQIGRDPNGRSQNISQISYVKRGIAQEGVERLQEIAKPYPLAQDINKLEKIFDSEDMSWVAIIHADGNGLGQIFLDFEKNSGNPTNRDYISKYRKFSLALDECTERAFRHALQEALPKDKEFLPVVPLIIGGDDLTVVCHGKYALEFTRVFLQEFEQQTKREAVISGIAKNAFEIDRLSACAGIAIVKRHFPFSAAYDLAEELIKSAKEVKVKVTKQDDLGTPFPCSAIDFHILYDAIGVDLSKIRKKLEPAPKTRLYNRPYIVSDDLNQADGQKWVELHRWQRLSDRVNWLNSNQSSQPDKDPVSGSQSHAIRTSLFLGKGEADAQYQLIQQRYDLEKFAESPNSLFYEDDMGIHLTSFLDALDAKNFLKNAQTDLSQEQTEEAA